MISMNWIKLIVRSLFKLTILFLVVALALWFIACYFWLISACLAVMWWWPQTLLFKFKPTPHKPMGGRAPRHLIFGWIPKITSDLSFFLFFLRPFYDSILHILWFSYTQYKPLPQNLARSIKSQSTSLFFLWSKDTRDGYMSKTTP